MPLVLVPTPIGNLGDVTIRALEVLRGAHVVACEDTRRTLKLLNHYGISKPLISLHEHNEVRRLGVLRDMLSRDMTVALVSDAGMPGISDPGHRALRMAVEEGFPVDVLPGPSAVITALVLSGLDPSRFTFHGFLRGRTSAKERSLRELARREETLVFYVSPHHLAEDLKLMLDVLGDRRGALLRELTKVHQEAVRGNLSEMLARAGEMRGEMVLVVEGFRGSQGDESQGELHWRSRGEELLRSGRPLKEVAELVSKEYGVRRNQVKEFLLGLLRGSD
ncbi:16S rRNA (cytidine(1402)-2'-O)-methyltransferase [Thermanaerovibrio acidaminovorans]|uniref:16S rRNA (cytidine(1402)-2'-O)-methyltransferase n=1 Tax=Thermanaerovibrio acidaminovorans TaxID=81462 RepID=UPI002493A72E|nr:16S rRNA (cytidine(1402)-2'-O)-methyltransferase [Thermanaerovibrio acidaminovorans]